MPLYSELNELKLNELNKPSEEDFALLFKCPNCKRPTPRGVLRANRDMCERCAFSLHEASAMTLRLWGEPKVFDECDLVDHVCRETRPLRRQLRAQKTIIKTLTKLVLEIKMTSPDTQE